jgi:hypothetical protein
MRTPLQRRFAVLLIICSVACSLYPAPLRAQPQSGVTYINPGQQPQTAPQYTHTTEHLNAVVVSSTDGKPVARVLVTSADRRLAVMTDFEGKVSPKPTLPCITEAALLKSLLHLHHYVWECDCGRDD